MTICYVGRHVAREPVARSDVPIIVTLDNCGSEGNIMEDGSSIFAGLVAAEL